MVTALLFYLPESPKFLIMQGRRDKALNILRGIFVTNTGKLKEKIIANILDMFELNNE